MGVSPVYTNIFVCGETPFGLLNTVFQDILYDVLDMHCCYQLYTSSACAGWCTEATVRHVGIVCCASRPVRLYVARYTTVSAHTSVRCPPHAYHRTHDNACTAVMLEFLGFHPRCLQFLPQGHGA